MSEPSNPPSRDWGHYGLTVAVGGLLGLLIFAEGRVLSAQQETESEKLRAEIQVILAEQQVIREERKAEAEETRRYIAEAIANANERAAVNSIRIDHLEQSEQPPPDTPPAN